MESAAVPRACSMEKNEPRFPAEAVTVYWRRVAERKRCRLPWKMSL